MTKNYLYDRFLVSNRNFTTEHVKNVQNSRFFVHNFKFFKSKEKNSQIRDFSRFFMPKMSNSMFF